MAGAVIKNYLLYALGEIILLVIGILIVMVINNWNEENKDRELEAISYYKLLEVVNQDRALLEKLIIENSNCIRGSNQILRLL